MRWTGGGGDPDLESRLEIAQSSHTSKIDVKGLTPKMIRDWTKKMPWLYDLFDGQSVLPFTDCISEPHTS